MLPSPRNPSSLARTRTALSISARLSTPRGAASVRLFASLGSKKEDVKKERVVILGSGWAGYAFARTLDPARYDRIVVSPRSYFVFTPLLASTAVGTLEFRATLESVRRLGDNVAFRQGWADDVDFARKVVRVEENFADGLTSQTILPPTPPPPPSEKGGHNATVDVPVHPAADAAAAKGPITEVPYDKLVIAVGAYSQTFGIEGVRQHANFLRDVGDARKIRLRVLSLFEQCASPIMSDESRRKLLHFAIVGGGPTGIEYAAELHDLIHEDLERTYPSLMPYVNITVYDIAPKILPMFDQTLASYAMRVFNRQHISVKTGHSIQRIRPDPETGGLLLKIKEHGDDEVGAGIVVWSTGLMQNPLVEKLVRSTIDASALPVDGARGDTPAKSLRLDKDPKTGGIIVDDRFRARLVDDHDAPAAAEDSHSAPSSPSPSLSQSQSSPASSSPSPSAPSDPPPTRQSPPRLLQDVFVIGDCAVVATQPTLPKTAQVASQEAAFLARALNKAGRTAAANALDDHRPFRFRNLGTMTYLGGWRAIHQSSADRLTGYVAWILWRTAYLTRSMSLKNKVLIPVYWFVSWMFGRDISRF